MKIQYLDPKTLVPYDKNSKIHDDAQINRIAESIKKTGWDQPIVVDRNLVIIKGHGRTLAGIKLQAPTVPVIIRDDLTPEQVKAARLNDNRSAIGSFDTELMRLELAEFSKETLDLLAGVFDTKELEFSLADLGDMNLDAFVPDVDAAVKEQEAESQKKADESAARSVPLGKALGVTSITGANELVMTRFMATIEHQTGKKGEEALIAHALTVIDA